MFSRSRRRRKRTKLKVVREGVGGVGGSEERWVGEDGWVGRGWWSGLRVGGGGGRVEGEGVSVVFLPCLVQFC